MTSSAIPARLEFQCGHAALVSLPRIKGETSSARSQRVMREKAAAQVRACDFCGPDVAIVVRASAPEVEPVSMGSVVPTTVDAAYSAAELIAEAEAVAVEAELAAEAESAAAAEAA